MKTTRLFLLGAAVMMLATSCEAVLDTLSKNPIFEFAGTTVYDGQKAFLGTTATCDIGWETDSPTIVDLNYNEHGKNCIATFQLPDLAKKVTTVKITATNKEDDTVEPYTGEITVAPWRLTIYKKGSDNKWNKVDAVYNNSMATFSYGASGNGAGTYKLQLEYLDKDNNYKAITSIPYRLLKLETFKVRWTGKLVGINGSQEEDVYSKEFTLNASPSNLENMAAAYIGDVGFLVTVNK